MRLSREIRFALLVPDESSSGPSKNSWAGSPSTNYVVPQLVLRCEFDGEIDPRTGFLCNITVIDQLLRTVIANIRADHVEQPPLAEHLLGEAYREVNNLWDLNATLVSVSLAVSPYLCYSISARADEQEPKSMSTAPHVASPESSSSIVRVQLTEQFEFSAAHRLHSHELSDEENRQVFGKCNNAWGHGHNYVIEVTVGREVESSSVDPRKSQVIGMQEFESTVKRLVIDRLDHKHLNHDLDAFADRNPTVENIVVTIFEWLDGSFAEAKLDKVRLYETPKTWAEFSS
ncbi:MAG: 6-pyruvoyltetrahydropterin/6-carboxytetrahydropterin synthase [Mariniblastus sp.]|jgi:6-pyruvoyltetrahydropterin/6-carboxytetrahydropterin synthase